MPLDIEKFVPRTRPHTSSEKGNPYAEHNGLGRYAVVQQIMQADGQIRKEYAPDENRDLEH